MENKFLNFKKLNENETELYIYGDIMKKDWIENWLGLGEEKTDAFSLKDALKHVDTPNLTVRINSYGGEVSEGLAIYSLLSDFKGHVKTIVDGFACSAASVIFMAGEERVVPENGLLMIHNAWTEARGDSNKMKKVAEDLEKITQPSLNIYTLKTNLSEAEIKEKMDKEEWITSQEAFEWGFSTSQERENKAMQALEADFVHDLVMKNKELQKELDEATKNETVFDTKQLDKIVELIEENTRRIEQVNTELNEIRLNSNNNDDFKEDAWASFFNTKK